MKNGKYFKFINTIKNHINTLLLILILMIMFGEYSQRDTYGLWGTEWHIEIVSPVIYYVSGSIALGIIVLIVVVGVSLFIKYLKDGMNETD